MNLFSQRAEGSEDAVVSGGFPRRPGRAELTSRLGSELAACLRGHKLRRGEDPVFRNGHASLKRFEG